MGRKTMTISNCFLPMILGKGVKNYEVTKDWLPEDCVIVDVKKDFPYTNGANSITLLLESSAWPDSPIGQPFPEIMCTLTSIQSNTWRENPQL